MRAPHFITLDKKVGETPLEAIKKWQAANPECANLPASYAGRLDPMASGTLLVLLGEECKRQDRYTGLDKEYEIEVVLDLATDTGDALGMPTYAESEMHPTREQLRSVLKVEQGAHDIPYPAFSSKTVAGKPLFLYALEGMLDTISIPTHTERIYRLQLLRQERIRRDELLKRVRSLLALAPTSDEPSKTLGADFRQHEIRNRWQELFIVMPDREFTLLRLRVACASGTYMRSLAGRIGERLGTHAFALSIHRTRIGNYLSVLHFWILRFR